MDRLKKAPPSTNSIIYNYDGIKLQSIFLRTKGREELDNDYAYAIEKDRALAREDLLNALYVAFTRAKESLVIIQKSKGSTFELLNLKNSIRGTLTCRDKIATCSTTVDEKLDYTELYYGIQGDLLELEDDIPEDLEALNFGLAMHYMLEMMENFKEESIAQALNMMLNKYGDTLHVEVIQDIKKRVLSLVNSKEFAQLTDGNHYKEQAIKYKKNIRYLDLLIETEDGYRVIDYKSSQNYSTHHHKQVSYYKEAIKAITQKEVKGYICYLLSDGVKIVEV